LCGISSKDAYQFNGNASLTPAFSHGNAASDVGKRHPEVVIDNKSVGVTKRVPPGDDGRGKASRRRFLRPDSWDGAALYRQADKRAQWVKVIVQMAIGIGTVIAVAILIWFPQLRTGGIAELALRTVASGLALAAVVELTYTLFTEGPDEAPDPLILRALVFYPAQTK